MFTTLIYAIGGALLLFVVPFVLELVAPIGHPSWRGRWIGLRVAVVKPLAMVALAYVLNTGWSAIGIPPLKLGPIFGGAFGSILAAVLIGDFLGYWHHRFMHRFAWPIHATHHSIEDLSAINSYAHFGEKVTGFLVTVIPLSLIQWEGPEAPLFVAALLGVLIIYIHTPTTVELGPLAKVFVNPRFHRIHHSVEPQHFGKNFGTLLTVWDRLFGTAYIPAKDEWPATGIAGYSEPRGVVDYAMFPLRFVRDRTSWGLLDRSPTRSLRHRSGNGG